MHQLVQYNYPLLGSLTSEDKELYHGNHLLSEILRLAEGHIVRHCWKSFFDIRAEGLTHILTESSQQAGSFDFQMKTVGIEHDILDSFYCGSTLKDHNSLVLLLFHLRLIHNSAVDSDIRSVEYSVDDSGSICCELLLNYLNDVLIHCEDGSLEGIVFVEGICHG